MGNDSTNKNSNKKQINPNVSVFKKPYPKCFQCDRIAQFEFINNRINNIKVY